ncbi:hypothetical protein EVJ50_11765 [Synechococcus sp. RSCCF101]|uniref:hypothetical protein n=1 Tax=Synechococcus sp. RSCCF101 TaxID=2511069 RepID=UPI00124907BA|nr:hypothetical protein [Synechococcus sp. RSCCF101]QEY32807.1 hypothetical protein EVJ50_11765 [Synechococcus sp. RSCCF101]
MTNLQSPPSQLSRIITPGRFGVAAPIVLGLLLAGAVLSLELLPQWAEMARRGDRLRELKQMERDLPNVEREVLLSREQLEQAREQQGLLLDVIAGSGDIRTFLAQLSAEAARTGVTLAFFEPLAGEEPAPEPEPGRSEAPDDAPPPSREKDPLAPQGYERRTVLLRAWADAPALLRFMRAMERLSLLVVQSDLMLEALSVDEANQRIGAELSGMTELKLLLSFYDRAPSEPEGQTQPGVAASEEADASADEADESDG